MKMKHCSAELSSLLPASTEAQIMQVELPQEPCKKLIEDPLYSELFREYIKYLEVMLSKDK